MKTIKFYSFLLFLLIISCGKNMSKTMDGKSYQLSTWDINQPDKQDPDLVVFKNGMMDSEACHQYGFTATPYQSTYQKGIHSFFGTLTSPKEGSIRIEGKTKENRIEGTMVWKKEGQADIHYGFRGTLKSE